MSSCQPSRLNAESARLFRSFVDHDPRRSAAYYSTKKLSHGVDHSKQPGKQPRLLIGVEQDRMVSGISWNLLL